MLKLVPFNSSWINHDKIDIKAIYRRPRYVQDKYGDFEREIDPKTGQPTWDLTGPLPIKQHTKWTSKGFEYVTLADASSLATAASFGTIHDEAGNPTNNWRQYQAVQTGSPWNFRMYDEGQATTTTLAAEQLTADVYEFGSAAVQAIRRRQDPAFTLPKHLLNITPGTQPGAVEKTQATEPTTDKSKKIQVPA
jgi:hypothetical protein